MRSNFQKNIKKQQLDITNVSEIHEIEEKLLLVGIFWKSSKVEMIVHA